MKHTAFAWGLLALFIWAPIVRGDFARPYDPKFERQKEERRAKLVTTAEAKESTVRELVYGIGGVFLSLFVIGSGIWFIWHQRYKARKVPPPQNELPSMSSGSPANGP